jgi:uncharacterized protein YlxW (UPF0749 family)
MSDYRDDRGQLRSRLAEAEAELAEREAELQREREVAAELQARLVERGNQIERLREESVEVATPLREQLSKRRRNIGIALVVSAGVAAVLALEGQQPPTGQLVLLLYALVSGVVGLIFITFAL